MGQAGIPIMNKLGYSMYWNSMWDNKIQYNNLLKQDIYLKDFFNLIFRDNVSFNIYRDFKNKRQNKNINTINFDNNLKKYILKNNKFYYYNSKIWILRYQNWVIIYNYICFLKLENNNYCKDEYNKKNISSLYFYYSKIKFKSTHNYNFYINKINDNNFIF